MARILAATLDRVPVQWRCCLLLQIEAMATEETCNLQNLRELSPQLAKDEGIDVYILCSRDALRQASGLGTPTRVLLEMWA